MKQYTALFEQPISTSEVEFHDFIKKIATYSPDDVRDFTPTIKEYVLRKGLPYAVGNGSSHVWIHRIYWDSEHNRDYVAPDRLCMIVEVV
jgi:hypothetical protein